MSSIKMNKEHGLSTIRVLMSTYGYPIKPIFAIYYIYGLYS